MKVSKKEPPSRFRYDWQEIIDATNASPGEWIMPEREYPHSLYGALVRGKNSLFPLGEYEFKMGGTRYDIDGKRWINLYIRKIEKEQ